MFDLPKTRAGAEGREPPICGLLFSGGVDSAILLAELLRNSEAVVPFYVRTGCVWQECESRAVRSFLAAVAQPSLAKLVQLDMPLADLYDGHWSMSGRAVPDQKSPDEAVFLPGRNPLLLIKPVLWCQQHGVRRLALATLASNPFDDATPEFFAQFQDAMRQATGERVEIVRPFETLSKRSVMELGRRLPLDLTFSCLSPVNGLHCGRCNKCAERQAAFRHLESGDPTPYAAPHVVATP
ncbi:MAG: 7-cyano-7-deazaguanine synthase [Pirellulales bacterium]